MFFRSCCFSVNLVVGFVALFALMTFLDTLPGLSFSFAVLLILPLLMASTVEGKAFARRENNRPSGKDCWIVSLKMMVIVSLIIVGVSLVRLAFDMDRWGYLAEIDIRNLSLALSAAAVCGWLLLRIGYAIGLASELKGQHTSHQC